MKFCVIGTLCDQTEGIKEFKYSCWLQFDVSDGNNEFQVYLYEVCHDIWMYKLIIQFLAQFFSNAAHDWTPDEGIKEQSKQIGTLLLVFVSNIVSLIK
jgi:hypothetical protein